MYLLANTGEPFLIATLFIIGIGVIHAVLTGTQGAWFAELFNTSTRTSGASIGYQVAASIAGFAPSRRAAGELLGLDRACAVLRGGRVRRSCGCDGDPGDLGTEQRAEVDAVIRGDASTTGVAS